MMAMPPPVPGISPTAGPRVGQQLGGGGIVLGAPIVMPLGMAGQQKKMLKADLERMQNDPNALGMTDAQREKMIGDATQQAGALQQAQTSAMMRGALGGTPVQQADILQGVQEAGDQQAQAAAQASVGAQQLHQGMVEREVGRIRGELAAASDRQRATEAYWRNLGINALGGLLAATTGMPMMAGLGAGMTGQAPAQQDPNQPVAPSPNAPPQATVTPV